jgi:hypothetical protein
MNALTPKRLLALLYQKFGKDKTERPAKLPTIYLEGPPGIGKSAIIAEYARATRRKLYDIRLSQLDELDLNGLPFIKEGKTVYSIPTFWPQEEDSILFFDELPLGKPSILATTHQILLDRRIREYELPPGTILIAAGNRIEDRSGAARISPAIRSRMCNLTLQPSNQDWDDWAVDNGIHVAVIIWNRYRPESLFQFDPNSREFTHACPRTWEYVSDVLNTPNLDPDLRNAMVEGYVGPAHGAEFISFLSVYDSLPDLREIKKNPTTATVPTAINVLYATSAALARTADEKTLAAFLSYAERMPKEFMILFLRDLTKLKPNLTNTKEFIEFSLRHKDEL